MATEDSLFGNEPDRYGYARYSIVVHAPTDIADNIQCFRQNIGMADFKTEPHVSISNTLFDLTDMDTLKGKIQALANATKPVLILFSEPPFISRSNIGFFEVQLTPELVQLRQSVVDDLDGIIKSKSSPKGSYWPHMTLYQEANQEEASKAATMGLQLDLGNGFHAQTLDLVGRIGSPREGTRHIIERFSFVGAD